MDLFRHHHLADMLENFLPLTLDQKDILPLTLDLILIDHLVIAVDHLVGCLAQYDPYLEDYCCLN